MQPITSFGSFKCERDTKKGKGTKLPLFKQKMFNSG